MSMREMPALKIYLHQAAEASDCQVCLGTERFAQVFLILLISIDNAGLACTARNNQVMVLCWDGEQRLLKGCFLAARSQVSS